MHIFFLRHGLTVANQEGRIQGQHDGKILAIETERYIAATVPLLRPNPPISVLLSSDLRRSVQTRQILKNFLTGKITKDLAEKESPLLREQSFGIYEGKLWEEVPEEMKKQRQDVDYEYRPYGGESGNDVAQRVKEFIAWSFKEFSPKTIACVTHAGWLRQLGRVVKEESNLPLDWFDRIAILKLDVNEKGEPQKINPIAIDADVHFDEE